MRTYNGGSTLSLPIASRRATQIQAYITTGATARLWSITVVTPNTFYSNAAQLNVTTGASPTITSVNPFATNTTQTLVIKWQRIYAGQRAPDSYRLQRLRLLLSSFCCNHSTNSDANRSPDDRTNMAS